MPNLFDFSLVPGMVISLLKYIPITFAIILPSAAICLILGFFLALIRMNKIPVLYQISNVYVSFMRGTPIIVQLYITYFGIPILLQYINYFNGTNFNISGVNSMVFVIVAFSLNEAAYVSETLRAGLESVEKGQNEAALSIGMTNVQAFFKITLPEAMLVSIPSLGNSFIGMIKNTSLAFTCAVVELTAGAKLLASRNYRFFESYIALAIIYWVITIIVARLFIILEKRLRADERQVDFNDISK